MAFFGWSLLLAGAWFVDCAIQNRPPLRSLKGVLADKPSEWASGVKSYNGTFDGTVGASPATSSGGGTTGSGAGGAAKPPPSTKGAKSGQLIGGNNVPAPIIAPPQR